MTYFEDLYPTRTKERIEPFARPDPVVYGHPASYGKGPLRPDEVDSFEENGFLFMESFLSEGEVKDFLKDLDEYAADESIKNREETVTEKYTGEIRSIFAVHKLSERFDRLSKDPRLLDIAHQLLGSDVYIHQSRINDKPAFRGSGFNWHSDFETWHAEDGMPRPRCISFSITLTENNDFNGPLMLIPGSHKTFVPCTGITPPKNWEESLRSQTLGVPAEKDLRALVKKGGIVAPRGPAGSLVIFESNTLHASANNLSPYPRRNLFFVCNSVENKPVAPFCGNAPRPEYLATRKNIEPLRPVIGAPGVAANDKQTERQHQGQSYFMKEPAAAQMSRQ